MFSKALPFTEQEDQKFDSDYFLADTFDDEYVREVLAFEPHWLAAAAAAAAATAAAASAATAASGSAAAPSPEPEPALETPAGREAGAEEAAADFTDGEREQLLGLPRKVRATPCQQHCVVHVRGGQGHVVES